MNPIFYVLCTEIRSPRQLWTRHRTQRHTIASTVGPDATFGSAKRRSRCSITLVQPAASLRKFQLSTIQSWSLQQSAATPTSLEKNRGQLIRVEITAFTHHKRGDTLKGCIGRAINAPSNNYTCGNCLHVAHSHCWREASICRSCRSAEYLQLKMLDLCRSVSGCSCRYLRFGGCNEQGQGRTERIKPRSRARESR